MGTETSKIVLNAHFHLRTANQQMSRPKRQIDDITDMRKSCRLRDNTSGRHPLGSSSRLLKVHDDDHDDDDDDDDDDDGGDDDEHGALWGARKWVLQISKAQRQFWEFYLREHYYNPGTNASKL